VRFTTLSGQSVTVTAGNKVRISRAGVLAGPSPATPGEEQIARDLTDIVGQSNQPPAVAATHSTVPLVITLSGTAVGVGIGVWQGTRPTVSTYIP
jgi:purine nucleoside phosphorylase